MTTDMMNNDIEDTALENQSDASEQNFPSSETAMGDETLTPQTEESNPMPIRISKAESHDLKPKITVFGVGGGGGNAVSNMIIAGLEGVKFVAANTDAQALGMNRADNKLQLGRQLTEGLGAGSLSEIGAKAAIEVEDEIKAHLDGSHMVFVTAGMGGGTGTGAAPIIASIAKSMGILTVAVVTKPFGFEGMKRMKVAEEGIEALEESVDTLITIPNQNLFRIANEKTTFGASFCLADEVLHKGVACITNLIVKEGLINLDFADVRTVMKDMGKAMMGTGEAEGEGRAIKAAEAAIANPLLDEISMHGARGLLVSISGGSDLGLYEVDEAASYIRNQVDPEANVIVGTTLEESLDGVIKVSVVATGLPDTVSRHEAGPINRDANRTPEPMYNESLTPEMLQKSESEVFERSDASQDDEKESIEQASIDRAAEASIAASLQSDLLGLNRPAEATHYQAQEEGVTVSEFSPAEAYDVAKYSPDSVTEEHDMHDLGADHEAVNTPYIPSAPVSAGRPMPKTSDFPLSHDGEGEKQKSDTSQKEELTVHSMWRKLLPSHTPSDEGASAADVDVHKPIEDDKPRTTTAEIAIPIPSFLKKQTG